MKPQSQQPPSVNPAAKQYGQQTSATGLPYPDPSQTSTASSPSNDWVSGGFGSGISMNPAQANPATRSPAMLGTANSGGWAPGALGDAIDPSNGFGPSPGVGTYNTMGGANSAATPGNLAANPQALADPTNPGTVYGQTKPMQVSGPGMSSSTPTDPTAPMNTALNQYGPTQNTVNTSNVPGLVGGNALGTAMQDAQHAAYSNATGYLDPQFANQQSDLQSKLANQGINQTTDPAAWNRAMDEFGRQKQFAYQQAQSNAVQQGNAAQSQLFNQGLAANQNQFGQNLQGANLANTTQSQLANQGFAQQNITNQEAQNRFNDSMTSRQQGISELLLQQQNPLDMYNRLTQGTQVGQPQFTNTPGTNVGGTDLLQAIQQQYGGQLNAYNTQVGSQNSSNAGIAAIIAGLLCDRRLKKNIRRIGTHKIGIPLYAFDYLWDEPGVGVMADELEQVKPEAVHTLRCGYKYVDAVL